MTGTDCRSREKPLTSASQRQSPQNKWGDITETARKSADSSLGNSFIDFRRRFDRFYSACGRFYGDFLAGLTLIDRRGEDHGQAASFHAEIPFNLCDVFQGGLDGVENFPPDVLMCHFPPAKPKRELHPVAAIQELARAIDLDFKVVPTDLRRLDADLLHLRLAPLRPGLVLLLLQVILVLSEVHYPADRRLGLRSDLDKVQTGLAGHFNGVPGLDDAGLIAFGVYQPDRRGTNAIVATKFLCDGVVLLICS